MFDNGYDRHTDYGNYSLFMKAGQNQRNLIADIKVELISLHLPFFKTKIEVNESLQIVHIE